MLLNPAATRKSKRTKGAFGSAKNIPEVVNKTTFTKALRATRKIAKAQ